jgi:hypothetical protein
MANPFCHIELTTSNVAGAIEFYKTIFDWKIEKEPGFEDYYSIQTGQEPGGGIMATPQQGVPTAWCAYVETEDVAATLAKVKGAGGKILYPKSEIPNIGWFAVISDPQGAVLGLFEAKK